jgi:2-C-methyl-D-erythritol 2,4-cyclodiphosphate synthase
VHPFVEGRPLVLAGVVVPHDRGLEGHSDADVVAHAVTDAVLGVAGMGDIGAMFPSDDASLEGADSMDLLARALEQVRAGGVSIVSVDAVLVAQEPRMGPHREAMQESLAETLGIDLDRVAVRATTSDHLGFVGRREGIACMATCVGVRDA